MLKRYGARVSQSVHALVKFFRPVDGPSAKEELAVMWSAFHALADNFPVRNHPTLGITAGERFQLGRVGDLVNRRKLDPAQCFVQCARRREARLYASRRRDLGQVEAFQDRFREQEKMIEFGTRRRRQVIPAEVRAHGIPGIEERLQRGPRTRKIQRLEGIHRLLTQSGCSNAQKREGDLQTAKRVDSCAENTRNRSSRKLNEGGYRHLVSLLVVGQVKIDRELRQESR